MSRRLLVVAVAVAVAGLLLWILTRALPTLWCSLIGTCNM